ncbi:MAG: hypothetical protein KAT05_03405, partial [Spirochaetes bacterium]|nr:hypothetical protein [Spirochaetota bacterium]
MFTRKNKKKIYREKIGGERAYFSIADRQLESFGEYKAFERSLLFNAIYQKGILVPDIFCFISNHLRHHIFEPAHPNRKSLFEVFIEKGIVVPVFRNPDTTSFNEALNDIREIQGIHREAERMADRLDDAVKKNKEFSPEYWPKHDIGENFEQIVDQHLTCEMPPEVDTESGINTKKLQNLWECTERWRIHCVGEARDKTKEITGRGLRRGEIMNAVGRDLGLPKDHKVNDMTELFNTKKSSKENEALKYFCRWVNDCYQYNQANEFDATANFPFYDPIGSIMVSSILPKEQSKIDPEPLEIIRETIKFPSINNLLKMSPDRIISISDDTLSAGYTEAMNIWQKESDEANKINAIKRLHEYANDVCKTTQTNNNSIAEVFVGSSPTPT